MKITDKRDYLINHWANWLVDAVAATTQDRRFLRGDESEDRVATEAILINAKKAIECALDGAVLVSDTE